MSTSSIQATPFADPQWHHSSPPPYFKDSHFKLQAETREYVNTCIAPFCEEWERKGAVPAEVFQRHAKLGYVAAGMFPPDPQYMGDIKLPSGIAPQDWDGFHDYIVTDELTRCGYMGVVWALSCGNIIGCPPLIKHGTADQRKRLLPSVYAGKTRFCLAVTEPGAGSDVANIATEAVRKGDKYIVNGEKKWITNAIFADYCTAAVRTGGPGSSGVSALIIPLTAKGVTRRKLENTGIHASGSTYIEFDDVEVPVSNLLGEENKGFEILMNNFSQERLWLCTIMLRLARVCAQDAYAYSTVRETFGKKLIENQVIRQKFSNFGSNIQSAQAWLEQIIWARERQTRNKAPNNMASSTALLKVVCGRTMEQTVRESQQIFGGASYARTGRGSRVEQIFRDHRVFVIGGGSEEIMIDLGLKQEERFLRLTAAKM